MFVGGFRRQWGHIKNLGADNLCRLSDAQNSLRPLGDQRFKKNKKWSHPLHQNAIEIVTMQNVGAC